MESGAWLSLLPYYLYTVTMRYYPPIKGSLYVNPQYQLPPYQITSTLVQPFERKEVPNLQTFAFITLML